LAEFHNSEALPPREEIVVRDDDGEGSFRENIKTDPLNLRRIEANAEVEVAGPDG
jgi:hypothetical protein